MRTDILLAVLVGLALVIGSDGAPKAARRRRDSNFILFNRDSASGRQQQQLQQQLQQQQQLHQTATANPVLLFRPPVSQHEAAGTRIVIPANTFDYEDNDDKILAGANSLEGLIEEDFVPGLIYTGQPKAVTALSARAASGEVATVGSQPRASNPSSRCILCEPGSCPVCYRLDQNDVCRHIYGCET